MPTIKLLSFNVKMLPGPGGEERANDIAAAILKQKYDIVCLQEVFDEDIREIFENKFEKTFRNVIPRCSDGDIFNDDSGLFFASRFPMRGYGANKGWNFVEFEQHTGWDSFSDKGIFGARLNLDSFAPGLTLLLFHTHLQSDEKHADVRRLQLQQMSAYMYRAMNKVSKPSNTAVIACGDMNVIGDVSDEYRQMLGILGYPRDAYRERNPAKPGFTWDAPENLNMIDEDDNDQQRLDYILQYDSFVNAEGKKVPLQPLVLQSVDLQLFGTDKESRLSDHFAVEAHIAGTAVTKTIAGKQGRAKAGEKNKRA